MFLSQMSKSKGRTVLPKNKLARKSRIKKPQQKYQVFYRGFSEMSENSEV